jgi:hypothetical protein
MLCGHKMDLEREQTYFNHLAAITCKRSMFLTRLLLEIGTK